MSLALTVAFCLPLGRTFTIVLLAAIGDIFLVY